MDLIIFYENGQTFRFGQVTNLKIDGDTVEFDYFGVSTQTHRHASFTDCGIFDIYYRGEIGIKLVSTSVDRNPKR